MLPLLLDAFDRLSSAWWYLRLRFVSGFFNHSRGPAVRHSLKLTITILEARIGSVLSPRYSGRLSGVRSINGMAGAAPGSVFQG